jgi:hypothetical protein
VGILWSGTAPTFDGTPVQNTSKPAGITVAATAAAGGTKGSGGAAAVVGSLPGADGTDGKAGVSQATLGL